MLTASCDPVNVKKNSPHIYIYIKILFAFSAATQTPSAILKVSESGQRLS